MHNRYLIDYLSYTVYIQALSECHSSEIYRVLYDYLPDYISRNENIKPLPKRVGFDGGINIENSTFIFYTRTGLVLVEHTGVGCEELRQNGLLDAILSNTGYKFTRIDIAHDLETETRPIDFAEKRSEQSTRAFGVQVSDTGETVYIGSKKSDRTCKIYRYNSPHPRSHLLRIEYTYRGHHARALQEFYIIDHDVKACAEVSAVRYGWQHTAYKAKGDTVPLKAWRADRKQSKTVRWMFAQVAPALAKLIKSGEISMKEFTDYVQSLLDE